MKDSSNTVTQLIKDFFSHYPLKRFPAKTNIVSANDEPPGVMYIESGIVLQVDISNRGNKIILNSFKLGAFFPMSWALNGNGNEYFYEAYKDVCLRTAPKEDVLAFIADHPDVTYDLLKRVYRGSEGLLRQRSISIGADARSRVLHSVFVSAKRFGEFDRSGCVRLDVDENFIAQQAGVSRETVSRQLKSLKESHIVGIKRGSITVNNLPAIETELAELA